MELEQLANGSRPESLAQIGGIDRLQVEDFCRPAEQRHIGSQDETFHHPLARTGNGNHERGAPRFMIDPALENAGEVG